MIFLSLLIVRFVEEFGFSFKPALLTVDTLPPLHYKWTQNPIKPPQTTKRKWTLFFSLTVDHSLGSKDAKSSILWSISRDQLNQSEVSCNKLQKVRSPDAYVTQPQTQGPDGLPAFVTDSDLVSQNNVKALLCPQASLERDALWVLGLIVRGSQGVVGWCKLLPAVLLSHHPSRPLSYRLLPNSSWGRGWWC